MILCSATPKVRDTPLLNDTIHEAFSKTAARVPGQSRADRAPSECPADVRAACRGGGTNRARAAGLGLAQRRPGRRVVHELCRMGVAASRLRANRRGAGERESGISRARAFVHPAQVGDAGAVPVGEGRAIGLPERSSKKRARGRTWRWSTWSISELETGPRCLTNGVDVRRVRDRLRRCDEHPVHVGDHGIAQRRAAHASQSAEQRGGDSDRHAARRQGPDLRAGAAVPLLRMRGRARW